MKYRHAVIVLAALLVTTGCGVPEPTTQTSMLRGPTPSPGLSIPPLLRITGTTGSGEPSGPAGDSNGSGASAPTGDQAQSTPAAPVSPATGEPTAPATDEFSTDQPAATTAASGGSGLGGPDLNQLAASAGCTDYAELDPPDPGSSVSGACTLDNQQVLLYSFTSEAMAAAFADSLSGTGVTADQLAQGPGYLFWADPGPIAKIKTALGAG